MRLTLASCCVLVACTSEAPRRAAPQQPNDPARTAVGPSSPAAADTSGWTAGAAVVEAGSVAGRADFNRLLRYTRATGTLEIKDSDPFASGSESKTPRVLNLTRVLSPDEQNRVEAVLGNLKPDGAALAQRCAPGGCVWVERVDADGTRQRLEHLESVQPVLSGLAAFFAEVRKF